MSLSLTTSTPQYYKDIGAPATSYQNVSLDIHLGQFYLNNANGDIYICHNNSDQNALIWNTLLRSDQLVQVQSDWTQSVPTDPDYIKNKPTFSAVATTGSYNDLSNQPAIPAAQIQSDWLQATITALDYIKNKPTLSTVAISGSYADLSNKPTIPSAQVQSNWTQANSSAVDFILNKPTFAMVATSGLYNDLSGKPTLATVASTGSYNDLSNKPTIPAAQIQSDWTQANNASLDFIKNKPSLSTVATTGAYSDLSGKPTLATVATTGAYADLSGKPTIPAAQIQSDWSQSNNALLDYIKNKPTFATVATTGAYADLSGKPTLATVATSGSYTDLSNKPTIPAAQIQSDWTQATTSALDYIKNKPTIPVINTPVYSTPTFTSTTTAAILSTTRDAQVVYSYPISITTLLATQTLTATLRYADDAAMTVNVVTVSDDVVGASGILNLALSGRLQTVGRIPANKYRRVTFTQAGGATVPTTIGSGQEVLL